MSDRKTLLLRRCGRRRRRWRSWWGRRLVLIKHLVLYFPLAVQPFPHSQVFSLSFFDTTFRRLCPRTVLSVRIAKVAGRLCSNGCNRDFQRRVILERCFVMFLGCRASSDRWYIRRHEYCVFSV